MLKMQNKLFFRSNIRTLLVTLWMIGCIAYHTYYFVIWGINDLVTCGPEGRLFLQLRIFFFYFIIMAFLAFDYFREVPNANLSEPIRITGRDSRNDFGFAGVMLQFVLLSSIITLSFSIYYFFASSTLTKQTALYSFKVTGLYTVLVGIMAILLGWFLARRIHKLMGYVILLLFCICVSTPTTMDIKLLCGDGDSLISKCLRILYFLPELILPIGNDSGVNIYGDNLYPIQFSQFFRILFWILVLSAGIASCYSFRLKKGVMTLLLCTGIGCLWFVAQPTNAWCETGASDITNSSWYLMGYYDNPDVYQEEVAADYQINRYEMEITPGWKMCATATLSFTESNTKSYDMTLYHLYEIDQITDLDGKPLTYERIGDYLTIQSETPSLEGVIITYSGGNSCFYCNKSDIYLPGWFPYYPIAGFHDVYSGDECDFFDNVLDYEAEFDITFLSKQDIYSDLPAVEKNHFVGTSKGALFLSGFYQQTTLDNGITCIYPYLDPSTNPYATDNPQLIEQIAQYMTDSGIWTDTQGKRIIITPNIYGHDSDIVYITDYAIAATDSWFTILKTYETYAGIINTDVEITPTPDSLFTDWYLIMKETGDVTYEDAIFYYQEVFEADDESEISKETFDAFFIELFGEDELSLLKGE